MSFRLHQTQINCSKCGESLWRVTKFTYDIGIGINQEIEEDPICRKCDPRRYYELLKHADHIESLMGTGQVQQTKHGKIEQMKEQEPK